ncbi:hypothetical protein [Gottfriedia solisilvae]|uniref:Uncharacterized protein n=1 Tax=Gottfriedia solisilvae TaxID=1516104 RepID=A0A8J3ANL7_9BACI|nr:hypothetical protein [Gottfriedia solisilvae]GGI18027.1 hypothetical protein GCM10007380_40880 [Gottfriedia solisilvae]
MAINSILQSKKQTDGKKRKTRKDKKWNIKVYVTEEQDYYLRLKSSMQRVSLTEYSTVGFCRLFERTYEFPPKEYLITPYMVHLNLEERYYEEVTSNAVKWRCSIREAAYRMFQFGLILGVL